MASSSANRPILGALTTTFTPPATCSTIGVVPSGGDEGWQGVQCFTTTTSDGRISTELFGSILYDYTCRPSSTLSSERADGSWSPGLICPAGYTRACSAALLSDGRPGAVTGPPMSLGYPLEPGETGVGCCPENYYCTGNTCVSMATAGATMPVMQCAGSSYASTSVFELTVASPTFTVHAMMIIMLYKSSDLALLKTGAPTTTVTVTSNPDSGSLSTGDKAGIGVGIVAAVLLIVALVLAWMLLRRRHQSKNVVDNDKYNQYHANSRQSAKEIGGQQMNELGGRANRSELAVGDNESELPG